MSDEQRRDKPAFEPPPWEREAFGELARKRAADQERDRAAMEAAAAEAWAARAVAAAQPIVDEPEDSWTAGPDESVAVEPGVQAEAAVSPASAAEPPAAAAADEEAKLDERRMTAMLLQLEGEEATVQHAVRPLSAVVSTVIGVIGAGMFALALYFAAKTAGSAIGLVGALAVGGFGVFFMGTAMWLWVRTTRGKGS